MAAPVGIIEIASRLDVKRATVDQWQVRELLPPPRWTVGGRPCWDWALDIEPWAQRTGRLPGPSHREEDTMTATATLNQIIDQARELYGPTAASFDYAYALGDEMAEGALERAIYLAVGEGTDPDRDAVEVRALRLEGELEPELESFRRVCRDRRYVGWSRWSSGPIRYAEEAEATAGEREVQIAQVTDPPDAD